jgi:hypothetical protein
VLSLVVALSVPLLWAATAPAGRPAAAPVAAGAAADPAAPVTFDAAGDFGSTAASRATFAAIGAKQDDVTLALGDYSYSTSLTEQQWCDMVKAGVGEAHPFELVSGNHESNHENGFIDTYATCLPNQLPGLRGTYGRQWWVDYPQGSPLVRFIAVSPGIPFAAGNLDYSAGSPNHAWAAAAIDGARAAGVPWVVVAMHVPCLSVGQYGCTGVEDLTNLLVNKKVDLVLNGHEHLYQRTHQVSTGPGCAAIVPGTFSSTCVADSDDAYAKGRGTVFATVGTGGVESRAANLSDPELPWFRSVSASNQNPAFGFLRMSVTSGRLDASFVRSGTGSFTDSFSMDATALPPNDPPSASATASCTDLACRFDGSASTDPDGSIVDHSWSFGDGGTGSGAVANHTYAAAGTFSAVLTVRDDDGATSTATRSVTVTAPPTPTSLASDSFTRSVASGWGTADVGGSWTASLPAGTTASVSGGKGLVGVTAGRTVTLSLPPLGTRSDVAVQWSLDKVPTGSGLYAVLVARRVAGQGDYRAQVRHTPTGGVAVSLVRVSATGVETALASEVAVAGLTPAAGDAVKVRVQAVGSGTTALAVRVWKAGTPEPTTWQRTATDTTAGLQASGGVALSPYLSSGATNAPITLSVDDLVVSAVP